jgi:hypothetical protein
MTAIPVCSICGEAHGSGRVVDDLNHRSLLAGYELPGDLEHGFEVMRVVEDYGDGRCHVMLADILDEASSWGRVLGEAAWAIIRDYYNGDEDALRDFRAGFNDALDREAERPVLLVVEAWLAAHPSVRVGAEEIVAHVRRYHEWDIPDEVTAILDRTQCWLDAHPGQEVVGYEAWRDAEQSSL